MVWKYINLFIESPIDGYLGCFQFLATTYKVAIGIQVHMDQYLEMEWMKYSSI